RMKPPKKNWSIMPTGTLLTRLKPRFSICLRSSTMSAVSIQYSITPQLLKLMRNGAEPLPEHCPLRQLTVLVSSFRGAVQTTAGEFGYPLMDKGRVEDVNPRCSLGRHRS